MTVNKEALREWVTALRSGNYEQINSVLKTDKGHCCLGVACEMFADRIGLTQRVSQNFGSESQHFTFYFEDLSTKESEMLDLPTAVQNFFGTEHSEIRFPFLTSVVVVDPEDFWVTAAWLNDSAHLNFSQIADCVEYEFELNEVTNA